MRFWDASALVSLLAKEQTTRLVDNLVEVDGDLVLWWVTPVEAVSAFCRLRREGTLDDGGFNRLIGKLDKMLGETDEIGPTDEVRHAANRLLTKHTLQAADALQLAAALAWAEDRPLGRQFVSLDSRLREAATREGFTVLPDLGEFFKAG